jgi:DNA-binding response OmpR family regulator
MLGHLEDLSVADIIQIVFLSGRTGVLEITQKSGRSTLLFSGGLIAGGSSPADPDLATHLKKTFLAEDALPFLKMKEKKGVPIGTAVIELGLMTREQLHKAITDRIVGILKPVVRSREGEFNFITADSLPIHDVEYDPVAIFGAGGISPEKLLVTEGQKIKPLRGLEETVRAGKALRGAATVAAGPKSLDSLKSVRTDPKTVDLRPQDTLPKPEPVQDPEPDSAPGLDTSDLEATTFDPGPASESAIDEGDPFEAGAFDQRDDSLEALIASQTPDEPLERKQEMKFRVASATSGGGGRLEKEQRRIVVIEAEPLLRVAIRRGFGKQGITTVQFNNAEEAVREVQDHIQKNRFFVTILDVELEKALSVLQFIKRNNRRLPVMVVYSESASAARRAFADAGADVFTKRPSNEALRGAHAQTELDIFCGELVDLSEKAHASWEQISSSLGAEEQRGAQFYEMSQREKTGRSFGLLKQLITELSEPGDVAQIAQTILRLSAEYLDRAVLFAVDSDSFVALGAIGDSGDIVPITERARNLRLPINQPSVLRDVVQGRKPHRGKLRREPANEFLLRTLGTLLPTETTVLPVLNEDEVVGLLYGDNAENKSPISSTSGLEIFLSQAGFALQNALAGSSR